MVLLPSDLDELSAIARTVVDLPELSSPCDSEPVSVSIFASRRRHPLLQPHAAVCRTEFAAGVEELMPHALWQATPFARLDGAKGVFRCAAQQAAT